MGVRLVIVSSSTGLQVDALRRESLHSLPEEVFFGDPSRASFAAARARYGMGATLLHGLSALPAHWSQLLSLVVLGAQLGAKRQALTSPEAAWQQGANALLEAKTGKVLYWHGHANPMDIGQPLRDTARALGRKEWKSPSLVLDYNAALDGYTSVRHPLVHRINRMAPYLLLLGFLLSVIVILLRRR